jgi:hypothetical protein
VRIRRAAAAALAAAAIAAAAAPAANGASRTLTVDGWWPRAMAFSDRALVWGEAAPVRVDPRRIPGSPPGAVAFTYYRAEAFRAALDRTGRRFTGTPEALVSIRTSIAAMAPGALAPMPGSGLVFAPYSRRFAAPVVACCTPEGDEIEVESDGRPDAMPTVAAAWDVDRVRHVQLRPDGTQLLRAQALPDVVTGARTARGLVALAPGLRAWVDPAAPRVLQLGSSHGLAAPRTIALPGDARGVWAAPGVVLVAVRSGARVTLLRTRGAGLTRVWSGRRLPRVAVGGGAVAAADGRAVLAARSGPLRRVTTARRQVDAVAVDGRRLAWTERATRRGARVAVLRLARIR